jgi:hypothetical protein
MQMPSLAQSNAQKRHFWRGDRFLPPEFDFAVGLARQLPIKKTFGRFLTLKLSDCGHPELGTVRLLETRSAFFTSPLPDQDSIQPVYRP